MSVKINRRHFIAAGAAAVSMPFLSRGASAQAAWPSRNIRMVCSYPAGGQTDLLARAFGDFITRQVGQTVVVESKAGASGSRARGAGRPHHPVLDFDHLCDEPGHDEEPRLRHG
jgi:tripartite-type tricarboxylate transporter receptor subunit TctC